MARTSGSSRWNAACLTNCWKASEPQLDRIQRTANAIAQLDVLAALAQVAAENNYCRPTVDESDQLTIVEGRHPVVEQMLKGSLFVPTIPP